MSDLARTLERETDGVELLPGAFDRLLRRRDREQLRRRAIVIAVVLLLVLVGIGGAVRVLDRSLNRVPASITPENVRDLDIAWSSALDGPASGLSLVRESELAPAKWPNPIVFPPAVVGDTAYVATRAGTLFSFPLSCGSHDATCSPTWVAHLAGPAPYPPTISGEVVYVTTAAGSLEAYPVDCATGGASCRPTWVAHVPNRASFSPVVADGYVFINDRLGAQLFAFPIDCAVGGRTCSPSWVAQVGEPFGTTGRTRAFGFELNQVSYEPVVAGGVVYVIGTTHQLYAFDETTGVLEWIGATPWRSTGGNRLNAPAVYGDEVFVEAGWTLYAFATDCAANGDACSPSWRGRTTDRLVMTAPVVAGNVVYAATADKGLVGHVVAFPTRCRTDGGPCRPLWLATADGEVTTWNPFVYENRVYVSSAIRGFTEGFPTTCPVAAGDCPPAFRVDSVRGQLALGQLARVSGGLVFTTNGSVVRAFDADCGSRTGGCRPLWRWTAPDGISSSPVIHDGELLIATSTGRLIALTPGGRS